jgi:hypothetical protein
MIPEASSGIIFAWRVMGREIERWNQGKVVFLERLFCIVSVWDNNFQRQKCRLFRQIFTVYDEFVALADGRRHAVLRDAHVAAHVVARHRRQAQDLTRHARF